MECGGNIDSMAIGFTILFCFICFASFSRSSVFISEYFRSFQTQTQTQTTVFFNIIGTFMDIVVYTFIISF